MQEEKNKDSLRLNPFPVLQEVKFPAIEENNEKIKECLEDLISRTFDEVKQKMCDDYCRYTCCEKEAQGAHLKELIKSTGLSQKDFIKNTEEEKSDFVKWLEQKQKNGEYTDNIVPMENHLSRWIHNVTKMSKKNLKMFAEYFGVDESYLCGEMHMSDDEIEDLWDSDICRNCPLNRL